MYITVTAGIEPQRRGEEKEIEVNTHSEIDRRSQITKFLTLNVTGTDRRTIDRLHINMKNTHIISRDGDPELFLKSAIISYEVPVEGATANLAKAIAFYNKILRERI